MHTVSCPWSRCCWFSQRERDKTAFIALQPLGLIRYMASAMKVRFQKVAVFYHGNCAITNLYMYQIDLILDISSKFQAALSFMLIERREWVWPGLLSWDLSSRKSKLSISATWFVTILEISGSW